VAFVPSCDLTGTYFAPLDQATYTIFQRGEGNARYRRDGVPLRRVTIDDCTDEGCKVVGALEAAEAGPDGRPVLERAELCFEEPNSTESATIGGAHSM
jgi:hypothetical protein